MSPRDVLLLFIALLGAAASRPLAAAAEPAKQPVLGVLGSATGEAYTNTVKFARQGLAETGFVEGRNLTVEHRWADFRYERLPALAAELVQRKVDVIFSTGSVVSALAAKSATSTIPIVFGNGSDPLQYGLVASMSRPGGNVTGISFINSTLGPKRIELLREILPYATTIAVLVNPKNPNAQDARVYEAAGRAIGLQIMIVGASSDVEVRTAFAEAVRGKADAMVVHVDALFNDHSGAGRIAALGIEHALPTISANDYFTTVGGLISYGANADELNRQAGIYIGRILKGEKPADLPVVQPTTFQLKVNLKTAKAIGLTAPHAVLVRADQVIQ